MKTESLWQVSVTTSIHGEDAVVALMERLFGQPASVYTNEETKQSIVTVYTPKSKERSSSKKEALEVGLSYISDCGVDIQPAQISIGKVKREDWSESWKKFFKTIEIGKSLLIKPSWSKQLARPNQAVVVLDPGLSFGTGQHATTRFCLDQLVDCLKTGQKQSFLDIGTGSGILAISAVKLGYTPVHAVDFDPIAVRVAKANAKRNRVEDRLKITRSDLTKAPAQSKVRYDMICANLISDLLINERKRILNRLKPTGKLVLAGILETQFTQVQEAYEAEGLKLITGQTEREWRSGLFNAPES